MRVDFDPAESGDAAAFETACESVLLDLGAADLAAPTDIARLATGIYRYAREGRRIAIPQVAPALAAACADIGLAVETNGGGEPAIAAEANVVFGSAAIDGAERVVYSPFAGSKLRVAVAGLGLIGEGVARRLADDDAYDLCAALVREPFKERAGIAVDQVTNDIAAFLATKPDVVVDALPDGKAGRRLIEAALDRGVSVVSANKQAVAGALAELTGLADESGVVLRYAASVGGGAPFVETTTWAAREADVVSLEAVLNGTVNYILTALAKGDAFEDAVAAAQRAGFAEPDPTADLSGGDAKAKLAILSFVAFGEEIDLDAIEIEPLTADRAARFAAEGGAWKQISRLERNGAGDLRAFVRFERRDGDALFAKALWEANALRIHLADGRLVECRGKGAGRAPTVESLIGDLEDIRRMKNRRPKTERTLAEDRVTA